MFVIAFDMVVRYVYVLLFFMYTGISSTILGTFMYTRFYTCPDHKNALSFIKHDYSINYESDTSIQRRLYAAIMVLVYPVGVLALFLVAARDHRKSSWLFLRRCSRALPFITL